MSNKRLETGDTLITGTRMLKAILTLSKRNRKQDLLPYLYKFPTLRESIAFFIECIVLHEHLYCSFDERMFAKLLNDSGLFDLSEVCEPLSTTLLIEEVKKTDYAVEIENIKLGFERINQDPSVVLESNLYPLFNESFPDLRVRIESNKTKESDWRAYRKKGNQRHFLIHENLMSVATGIAYTFTTDEVQSSSVQKNDLKSTGYKTFGEQSLIKTREEAKKKAKSLNDWLQRDHFTVQAPIVFNYVVGKANKKKDLLSVAIDIRNSKEASAFRKQCKLFEQALKVGDDQIAIEMIDEINDKIEQLAQRLKTPSIPVDIAFPFSISLNLLVLQRDFGLM